MKKTLKSIAVLVPLTTLSIHCINKCISFFSVAKKLLRTDLGHFYEWRFGQIFYKKTGSGLPIILIHDLNPCSSSYEWDNIIHELSKKHTVYSMDLLGCGRSDKPNLTYTNYLYVQMISDFIKNVIGKKTNVIATGSSSSFVLMACNNNPELFSKLMMINPESFNTLKQIPGHKEKFVKKMINSPVIGTLIYNITYSKINIINSFSKKYLTPYHVPPKKYVDSYYESAHLKKSCGKFLLSSIYGNYLNLNIIHAVKSINHSVYIIGSSERDNIESTIDNYVYYNPSFEAAYIDNSKYLPQLEKPRQLLNHIHIYFA